MLILFRMPLYAIFSLFLLLSPALPQESSIDWSPTRKLTWDDFRGTPPKNSANAALTHSGLSFDIGFGSNGFSYFISCRFDKTRSWGRVKTDPILQHEQAHFDITEIHARKLYRAFKNYRYDEKTVEKEINTIYEAIIQEHHAMQVQYDSETEHSLNGKAQAAWLKKISGELKNLDAFAKYPRKK